MVEALHYITLHYRKRKQFKVNRRKLGDSNDRMRCLLIHMRDGSLMRVD